MPVPPQITISLPILLLFAPGHGLTLMPITHAGKLCATQGRHSVRFCSYWAIPSSIPYDSAAHMLVQQHSNMTVYVLTGFLILTLRFGLCV